MKSTVPFIIFMTTALTQDRDRDFLEIMKPENNYYLWVTENVKNIMRRTLAILTSDINCFSKIFANVSELVEDSYVNHMRLVNASRIPRAINFSNLTEIITESMSEIISNRFDIDNSEEFMDFVDKFIKRVDSLSVKDFLNRKYSQRGNLKPWVPSSLESDHHDGRNRRLYHGKPTKIRKYPFVASIHVAGQFRCGGSIISRDLVITAASCLQLVYNNRFFNENPQSLAVRIGSDYTGHEGELIEALEVYFHPSYNPRNLNNNIAIIRLQRLIVFSKRRKRVRRIVLDHNEGLLPYDIAGIVTLGWGPLDKTNRYRYGLKLAIDTLQVYHLEECKNIYSRYYVTNQNFCAGYLSKGSGACNNDVGGPGVVSGRLSGIISFGSPSCGNADSPTVFTRIGPYIHWIQDIIDKERIVHRVRTTLRPRKQTRAKYYTQKTFPIHTLDMYTQSSVSDNEGPHNDEEVKQNVREAVVQEMSYGIDSDFDIFKPTEKPDILEHPLVNKSLVFIPELYGITASNSTPFYTVPALTLAPETSVSPSTAFEMGSLLHPTTLTMPPPTPGPSRPTSSEEIDTIYPGTNVTTKATTKITTTTATTKATTKVTKPSTNVTETATNLTEILISIAHKPNSTRLRYFMMRNSKEALNRASEYEPTDSVNVNEERDNILNSDASNISI